MARHILLPLETKKTKKRNTPLTISLSLSKKVILFATAFLTSTVNAETCPQVNEIQLRELQTSVMRGTGTKPAMFVTDSGWTSSPIIKWEWICDGTNCLQEPDALEYVLRFVGATFSIVKDGSNFVKRFESCNYIASHYSQPTPIILGRVISMRPPDYSRRLTVVVQNEKNWRPSTYICDQSIDNCKFDLTIPPTKIN